MNLTLEDIEKITQIAFFVVTGSVAVFGLRAWRLEMSGRVEFDVSRRVVAGAYKIRDSIKRCQAAFMSSEEWADRTPVEGETETQKRANESYFAFGKRFNKVIEELNNWYPSTVEAEALFGAEAKVPIEKLKESIGALRAAIDIYHRVLYRGTNTEKHEKYYNIIYGLNEFEMPSDQEDDHFDDNNFQKNLDESLIEIESFFLKHMNRKAIIP